VRVGNPIRYIITCDVTIPRHVAIMAREIEVRRLRVSSLIKPAFVGLLLVWAPLSLVLAVLVGLGFGSVTFNDVEVTGARAVVQALLTGPLMALGWAAFTWIGLGVGLWAYARVGSFRLQYDPPHDQPQEAQP
jgi:hypothetical protein